MKIQWFVLRVIAIIGVACSSIQPVHALNLSVVPSQTYQFGIGATVVLGLTVLAGTNMNGLTAGGSFNTTCMSDYTGNIPGHRDLSSTVYFRYNQLTVTIPETLPAYMNMPGFEQLERGRSIQCSFDWEAHARESSYTIGIPGTSITVGGESQTTSGQVGFTMDKPGRSTGDDDACIP